MRCRWVIVLIFLLVSRSSAAYEIVPVDRIDGHRNLSLSADGRVVVGSDLIGNSFDPIRWTRENGAVSLGQLAGYQSTVASEVSDDGTVIVGRGNDQPTEAYRWTQQGGMVGLGPVPGYSSSIAAAVSGDGSTVVGRSESSAAGFVWTAQRGMVRLSPAGADSVTPVDVSADGRVVAISTFTWPIGRAVLWNEQSGFQELGPLPAGWEDTYPGQISADGKTVLGSGGPDNNRTPFLWSQDSGFRILPGPWSAMTPDASVLIGTEIVGQPAAPEARIPMVWDESHGARRLHDVLAVGHGFTEADLFFDFIHDISADQRTLLVRSGDIQLWAVYLDKPLVTPVPEPAGSLLVIAGVLAIAAKCRRHAQ